MFSLQGKVAIVTGAASGIGAAIAECFGQARARVYVADCNAAGAQLVAEKIARAGGLASAEEVDVGDELSCKGLVSRVLSSNGGRCDILVNNAGIGHVGTILTTTPDDLERLWRVNVKGMYYLSREIVPSMRSRRSGAIVNIASTLGFTSMEDRFAYTITKHAVIGMTRSMAMDLASSQVRINCICPGRVETPFVQARLKEYPDPQKYLDQMVAPHPLKRMAQPAEIAAAALYLASDEASFATGSSLVIDGGYSAGK